MNTPGQQRNATAGPSSHVNLPLPSTPTPLSSLSQTPSFFHSTQTPGGSTFGAQGSPRSHSQGYLPRPVFAISNGSPNGTGSSDVNAQQATFNAFLSSQMNGMQNMNTNTNANGHVGWDPSLTMQVKTDEGEENRDELDESDDGNDSESEDSFKIRHGVPLPTQTSYSAKELHASIHQGDIDLEPPYQRDVVWPNAKQVKLIDSLFRNFYIPPIVFAQSEDEEGNITKVCVDGKQRLTSIQKFMDGHIAHRDNVTKKNWWYTCLGQSSSQQLEIPAKYKQGFDNIRIHCIEYTVLGQDMEREIFQRVQLGVALTAAEKLQAISSPWGSWISSLESKHVHIENGLRDLFQWDVARGRDFQNIAHFIYCCDKLEHEHRQEIPTAVKIDMWLRRPDGPSQRFQKQINNVLDFMTYLAGRDAKKDGLVNGFTAVGKRVAPVEFVFIGVLLFVMSHASADDRANAVLDLRNYVRFKHTDIRMNAVCGKSVWKFITRIQDGLSSSEASMTPPPKSGSKRKGKGVSGSGNKSLKRGRESEDEFKEDADADGEEDPSYKPVSKTSRGRKTNRPRK